MRIARNWKQMSTHMPTLIRAVMATGGDVCEVGTGFSSTALLHWLCQGRKLVSYENDPAYLHFAKKFQSNNHRIRTMDEIEFERPWSVVFIDHTCKPPHTRGADAIKFTNADLIVMHDTENEEEYGYAQVWPKFRYRYDWRECKPWTTVVSNTINLDTWT